MNLAMKIFNAAMFHTFQGWADQGQIFEDDAHYVFKKSWKYQDGETKPFLVSGRMIYQALNNSPSNDRFGNRDTDTDHFINQMILNLLEPLEGDYIPDENPEC